MFGSSGQAYVYTIHARQCFNVVTEAEGTGSAVLIRSLAPLTGLPLMRRRRRRDDVRDLCRGPARLCEALGIGRESDGWDLTRGRRLWITKDATGRDFRIGRSRRIGVTSAAELPLRFFAEGCLYVSGTQRQRR